MVKQFHENGTDCFNYAIFVETFTNVKEYELKAALYNLESDYLVTIKAYENKPLLTFLNVKGISKVDEDTLIRKGYVSIKEILALLNWYNYPTLTH